MAVQTFYETVLARKQVLLLRSGLKRSLRSCNDNQLSSPLSLTTLSFFSIRREVKSFPKYNSSGEYLARVSETSGESELDDTFPYLYRCACTCRRVKISRTIIVSTHVHTRIRLCPLKYLRVELYIATLHFQLMEVVDWNEIEARSGGLKHS